MRVLAFAASSRKESLNRKLIELAARLAEEVADAEVDLADFSEFAMPVYDGDLEAAEGLPPGADELRRRLERADATMIATPEYNYSIAGPLKNAIDWVSRERPMPWRGRSIYLMSASPGPIGGIRGLWQTRIPLEGCGALVFPDMFALARAREAFDEGGRLVDGRLEERLRQEVRGFLRLVETYGRLWTEPSRVQERAEIERALEDQTDLQPGR
jgi:chromate reductase, NAD(P)H dehydrogenase (quinone)